jgi:hypothetical protein
MREIKAPDAWLTATLPRLTKRTLRRSRGQLSQDAGQRRPDRHHQDTDEAADQDIGQPRILCQAFALGGR